MYKAYKNDVIQYKCMTNTQTKLPMAGQYTFLLTNYRPRWRHFYYKKLRSWPLGDLYNFYNFIIFVGLKEHYYKIFGLEWLNQFWWWCTSLSSRWVHIPWLSWAVQPEHLGCLINSPPRAPPPLPSFTIWFDSDIWI